MVKYAMLPLAEAKDCYALIRECFETCDVHSNEFTDR